MRALILSELLAKSPHAAPDLLAACEEALCCIEDEPSDVSRLVPMLRAAISKATQSTTPGG